MFSSNQSKFILFFALLGCQACSFWQSQTAATPPATLSSEEFAVEIPFSTKEPDAYQAEIVSTNYAGGEKTERKTFVARNGEKLRCDYESKISFLQISADEKFSIHTGEKIYAESQPNYGLAAADEGLQNFLTSGWLNEKTIAKFENSGVENDLTKYRVVLDDAKTSEVLIFVDENFKFPVRQEFYSINGEQKNLVFSIEIRNLKLETDENLFELRKDYKKVSADEFQKTIWREKFN